MYIESETSLNVTRKPICRKHVNHYQDIYVEQFGMISNIKHAGVPHSGNQLPKIFRYIFRILNFCLVFPFPNCKPKLSFEFVCSHIVFIISLSSCVLHLLSCYWMLSRFNFQPKSVASTFMTMATVFHRICLTFKFKSLRKLFFEMVSPMTTVNSNGSETKKTLIFPVTWLALSVTMDCLLVVLVLYYSSINYAAVSFFPKINSRTLEMILWYTYHVSFPILLLIPMHVFSVYYYLVCQQIQRSLNRFGSALYPVRRGVHVNYNSLYQKQQVLRKMIRRANEDLQVLVFTSALYNGSAMYFIVTSLLHPEYELLIVENVTTVILSINTFSCFLLMMRSATGVGDASRGVSEAAEDLDITASEYSLSSQQLQFQVSTQYEMSMTVWGIGRISRSLLLSMFGTIFTYCILIDGISSLKSSTPVK